MSKIQETVLSLKKEMLQEFFTDIWAGKDITSYAYVCHAPLAAM